MEKEKLKDILINAKPGDFDRIMDHIITQEDIEDFNNLYSKFVILENEYKKMIFNRKEAAKELTKILSLLHKMNDLIGRDIASKKDYYEISVRNSKDININEQYKVFETLRQLASHEAVQYDIKTIEYTTFDNSERHGYRTTGKYTEKIIILAEKEALSKLDNSKKMPYLNQQMLLDIYNQGFSMVLAGNNECTIEHLNIENVYKLGEFNPIIFYLHDDELAHAASSLMEFIEENGADFSQIDVNDLIRAIKSKYKNRNKKI